MGQKDKDLKKYNYKTKIIVKFKTPNYSIYYKQKI